MEKKKKKKKKKGVLSFFGAEILAILLAKEVGGDGLFLKVASFSGGEKKVPLLLITLGAFSHCIKLHDHHFVYAYEFMKWSALHIITQVRW